MPSFGIYNNHRGASVGANHSYENMIDDLIHLITGISIITSLNRKLFYKAIGAINDIVEFVSMTLSPLD